MRLRMPRLMACVLGLLLVTSLASVAATSPRAVASTVLHWPAATDQVEIVRDAYGVPQVYAPTLAGVSYGAGYAIAEDKFFLAQVFRLAAHGNAHLILPTSDIVAEDKTWRRLTYTAVERQRQFASLPDDARAAITAYVAGMNAWIDEANADPTKMPFEMAHFGFVPIESWTVDDTMAVNDVLFQLGGACVCGNEIKQAALRDRLVSSFGLATGMKVFDDLIRTEDPHAPVTIDEHVDWQQSPTYADEAFVDRRRTLNTDDRLGLVGSAAPTVPVHAAPGGLGDPLRGVDWQDAEKQTAWLHDALQSFPVLPHFGSNAQLVAPRLAKARNALMTAGPQIPWAVPSTYTELGLHGGGFDVTGVALPGFGPFIGIGRGRGFAWTITSGYSDLRDMFVVDLDPADPNRYRHGDGYEPMDCRTESYDYHGVPLDSEQVCRTRLGLVVGRSSDGRKAYVYAASTYNKDANGFLSWFLMSRARSLRDFATAAELMPDSLNVHFADDRGDIGFWHTGNHPLRASGVDLRLPQDGDDGGWLGLRSLQDSPHAVNPPQGYLVNWNNEPARGWERERSYNGFQFRALELMDAYDGGVDSSASNGGRIDPGDKWTGADLSRNLRHIATGNPDFRALRDLLPAAGDVKTPLARRALELTARWNGEQVDEDHDNYYDASATTIAKVWESNLFNAVFGQLGADAGWAGLGELIWVLSPEQRPRPAYDWLHAKTPAQVSAAAFEAAVTSLAARFKDQDPAAWRTPVAYTAYSRTNADILPDAVWRAACAAPRQEGLGDVCVGPVKPGQGSPLPGDLPDAPYMNRGAYNQVVTYLDPVGEGSDLALGWSSVQACSVVPPGQSGFIDVAGRESPHYRDQFDLYNTWQYKLLALTPGEVSLASRARTICRP